MTPVTPRPGSRTLPLTAAALAALVLAVGVGIASRAAPPGDDGAIPRTIERYAERARHAEVLRGAASTARRADSVQRTLASRDWGSDSLVVLAAPDVPAWRRAVDERFLRRAFQASAPHDPGVRVAVAILLDEAFAPGGGRPWRFTRGTFAFLPEAVDGRTCLVVIAHGAFALSRSQQRWAARLDSVATSPRLDEVEGSPASLGACGWRSALGAPGRGMRAWLDSTAWLGAHSARFVPPGTPFAPWRVASVERGAFLDPFGTAARGLATSGLQAQACASGHREACRSVLHQRAAAAADARDGVLMPPIDLADLGTSGVFAADPRTRLLDDLWNAFGPATMRTLWRDDRPFDEAFRSATGQPLDAWTQRWMERSIRDPRAPAGPLVPARVVLVPLLVAALALAIALRGAARMGLTPVR